MGFGTWIENKEVSLLFLFSVRFAGEKALLSYCQKEEKTEAEQRQRQVRKKGSNQHKI